MSEKKIIDMLDGAIDLKKVTAAGGVDDMEPKPACIDEEPWGAMNICYVGDEDYEGYKIIEN